ncbi:MAG: TetR/AcrR family transcriptional regulator [Clostridium sp.]|uniref:TetR/AcrR family transcriptional regulator n=1 Tax=Clostridium sp. TaxID=1506 RepID=UPI00290B3968|nr:TetR/AcrR family transcriptional regulator [Clostridium sp.]MDU5110706.1 TetR/AcrR family transcriptional regulator [Clostridium sp.]
MAIENRREREIEEMKELILSSASAIVASEGFEKLSIRKIAKSIEYSPAIIYHYFKDKEEIINILMQRGYKKIISAVSSVNTESLSIEERLTEMTKNYIYTALKMPDEFLAAQLNTSKEALNHTSYLFKGASKDKPALSALYKCLTDMQNDKLISENKIELTAQIIAVSTLGLIIKLIVEKEVISEEQKEKLIDFYSKEIVLKIASTIQINN